MPAFKYTSQANVPGPGGRQRPQAGSLSAPQVNAPINRPVEMGGRVQQQAVREQPNAAGMAVSSAVVDLGNMFYKRSMQMAEQQSELEADEAISQYRRAVSDTYYSEENGLFLKSGKEGARLYSTHKGDIDSLRDTFTEGLSESAKRKYMVKVTGYHNQHLDQLAKKQYSNIQNYKAQVRVFKEGTDAGDIATFIEDGNINAVTSTINDNDPTMTPLEQEGRRDRLIASALSSAIAQKIPLKEFEALAEKVSGYGSQEIKNNIPKAIDTYARILDNERQQAITEQNRRATEYRFNQDSEFSNLLRDKKLTREMIEGSALSGTRKEYYHNQLDGLIKETPNPLMEQAYLRASNGTLTWNLKNLYIENGFPPDKIESLFERSEKNKKYKTEPKKSPRLDQALETWKDLEFLYKGDEEKVFQYHDLKQAVIDAAERGDDPVEELKTLRNGAETGFWSGLFGKEREPAATAQVVPEFGETEMAILQPAAQRYFQQTGGDFWAEVPDQEKNRIAEEGLLYLRQEDIKATGDVGENDIRTLNLGAQTGLSGLKYDVNVNDPVVLDTVVQTIDEEIRERPASVNLAEVIGFAIENGVDLARFTPGAIKAIWEFGWENRPVDIAPKMMDFYQKLFELYRKHAVVSQEQIDEFNKRMKENATGPDRPEGYGTRRDGTQKGNGFLGPIKTADGRTMTELTVGVEIDGKEMDIPTIVPTLTDTEIEHLVKTGSPTDKIVDKAIEHAIMRLEQNKSVFAD